MVAVGAVKVKLSWVFKYNFINHNYNFYNNPTPNTTIHLEEMNNTNYCHHLHTSLVFFSLFC